MKKYEVKEFKIEYTGGGVYVGYGEFNNHTYFSISDDMLLIYNEDEYVAMNEDDYDGYTWEQNHTIESYSYDNEIYLIVLKQLFDGSNDNLKSCSLFDEIKG